ncbi:LOG family protein [Actinosynnema sp. NPDC023587]|uniref:LOG family protein n=1 Tax=Actinosynnema sp. NPDC023587 TaxID=3154695 RepID=UPI0033C0D318
MTAVAVYRGSRRGVPESYRASAAEVGAVAEAADDLLRVDTMRDRKALMEAHGDAFPALPGGIGTAEELFEVWTARVVTGDVRAALDACAS